MKLENNNIGYSVHLTEETLIPEEIDDRREMRLEILLKNGRVVL